MAIKQNGTSGTHQKAYGDTALGNVTIAKQEVDTQEKQLC